ncbi:hypothetical protein HU200_002277 [Digitaria exilis]|uniref:Uncharacterized protein n=1 Tax=Digitaria exilis TaxID=1010633 RepID=A0A835BEP4_9POAL|nr:hypothetical protein HU200_037650 [Digitaria exilis]KAF8779766.1 hypothetical protein HU200_002277 [Digitaria exilis]
MKSRPATMPPTAPIAANPKPPPPRSPSSPG